MKIQNVRSLTPLLQVYDMRKSIAWYRDVLGFEVLQTHEPEGHLYWAMLKLGGAVLMLNSKYEDDKRPPQPEMVTGRDDVTLYFGCDDVDAAYEQLKGKCDVAAPKTAYYGMRQMIVRDPDQVELVFQHPVQH